MSTEDTQGFAQRSILTNTIADVKDFPPESIDPPLGRRRASYCLVMSNNNVSRPPTLPDLELVIPHTRKLVMADRP